MLSSGENELQALLADHATRDISPIKPTIIVAKAVIKLLLKLINPQYLKLESSTLPTIKQQQ